MNHRVNTDTAVTTPRAGEHIAAGWDNNGKPGNQVATKSLPSHEIFGRNPAIITIYVKFIY